MATQEVATKPHTDVSRITPAPGTVRDLLRSTKVQERFEHVLGDKTKAAMFVSSLSTLVYANDRLRQCDQDSIIAAAVQAAALDLPINPNLGFAYIVPYKGKAQFQPGYKGIIQLALRTGQYARLEVNHAREGEVAITNRFTGDFAFGDAAPDAKVAGVMAYMRLTSGFEKFVYWTIDQIHKHGKRYSPGYARSDSSWQTNPDAMELKVVLSNMLRKWGIMSVELVQALSNDDLDFAATGQMDETTPEQHARDKAALFPTDNDAGGPEAPAPQPPPDNAALDIEVMEADKAKA